MQIELELKNIQDTINFAHQVADLCKDNNFLIFLEGEIGVGKTTFAQALIKKLTNDEQVILSPTYSFMNIYKHKYLIYHFDLYRLENETDIFELGFYEYLQDKTAIRLVEWPKFINFIKPDIRIIFSNENNCRKVIIHNYLTTI